jgi:hypothetical protein
MKTPALRHKAGHWHFYHEYLTAKEQNALNYSAVISVANLLGILQEYLVRTSTRAEFLSP